MKVLLAGASGAIGLPLVQQLRGAGHDVTAIHRSATGRSRLITAGATPLRVDVLDRAALLTAIEGHPHDAVISQLTAMKKPPVTHNDLAAERIGAARFVTQSMVFGYGYGDFGGRCSPRTTSSHRQAAAGSSSIWPRCAPTSRMRPPRLSPPSSRANR